MPEVVHLKTKQASVRFNYVDGVYLVEKKIPGSRSQVIHLTDNELDRLIEYRQLCQLKRS